MDTHLIVIFGLLTGGVINALADDLPAARMPRLPRYPDGRRRPRRAWLGITAFALGLRGAPEPATDSSTGGDCERRRLSWRHPLVEVATAALMALTFAVARDMRAMAIEETLIWLTLAALFVLIAVIDLEHLHVIFAPTLACGLIAIIGAIAFPQSPPTIPSMLFGAACAGITFSLVCLGGRLFARTALQHQRKPATVFGQGDVTLMTLGGFIVGFPDVLVAIALTILLGGIGALAFLLAKSASGGYRRFSAMPYAPYILASTYMVMLLGDELNHLIVGL